MTDEPEDLGPELRAALREHNSPPSFPAESVWAAIQRHERLVPRAWGGSARALLGLAASLALCAAGGAGYLLGRAHSRVEPAALSDSRSRPIPADTNITVAWF